MSLSDLHRALWTLGNENLHIELRPDGSVALCDGLSTVVKGEDGIAVEIAKQLDVRAEDREAEAASLNGTASKMRSISRGLVVGLGEKAEGGQ